MDEGLSSTTNTMPPTEGQDMYDMVCIGFGPASLAIAVALEDWAEAQTSQDSNFRRPKVRFLERQDSFKWHAGMLIQSAKMQISFLKDLATARDPLSRFTFLNYLKEHGRLAKFARLNTFLPSRAEFADYMKWVAGHFDGSVGYGQDVLQICPVEKGTKVSGFEIETCQRSTREITRLRARQVIISVGGTPAIPALFQLNQPWCLHSSQYETTIDSILPNPSQDYNIAVIGSGQSAAEIFDDLSRRRPNAQTTLIFRDSALRPSDDSPFVNEVFDPSAVDAFYQTPAHDRRRNVARDKATNYSVVRLELIERIYQDLCIQSIHQPDRARQLRRIMPSTEINGIQVNSSSSETRTTTKSPAATLNLRTVGTTITHDLPVDVVILATGYTRKAHLNILRPCQRLNPSTSSSEWMVQRDYGLVLNRKIVESGVGIWLQGCNEETHGLSDSLLSILATRSGELVDSMFGVDGEKEMEGGSRPSL